MSMSIHQATFKMEKRTHSGRGWSFQKRSREIANHNQADERPRLGLCRVFMDVHVSIDSHAARELN